MKKTIIKLNAHEIQSGSSRVKNAEGLIKQLPVNHDGRNTWLLNYGTGEEAIEIRKARPIHREKEGYAPEILTWDEETDSIKPVNK